MREPRTPHRIGTQPAPHGGRPYSVWIEVSVADGRLSITGTEGPKSNGDAFGSCGQIHPLPLTGWTFAPGWDETMVARLNEVWDQWHLNDMRAGSPRQRAYLRAQGITKYDEAKDALAEAGLDPDPEYLHNDQPYRYGSAWLTEELPADVVAFIQSLPPADKPYPWGEGYRG